MAAAPRIGRRFALTVLAAAMLALVLSPSASAAKLQVGVGRADITPPTGYYMMGWVRSDGVIIGQNTRLWARVIVLRRGGEKVALVSEDLNGIPGGMMAQAAKRVHELGFRSETSSTPPPTLTRRPPASTTSRPTTRSS